MVDTLEIEHYAIWLHKHNKFFVLYKFAIVTFIIFSKYEEQCKVVPKFKYAKFDMHDKVKEKKEMWASGCRIVFTRQNQRWHDRVMMQRVREVSGMFFIISHNVVLFLMIMFIIKWMYFIIW